MGLPEGVACLPPSPHCHGAVLLTIERKGWVILDINKKMATINSTKDEHKIKEKQEKKKKIGTFRIIFNWNISAMHSLPPISLPHKI